MEIELKGWKAVAAVAAVLAFIGFRLVSQTQALHGEGKVAVERYLVLEVARGTLPQIEAALSDPSATEGEVLMLIEEFSEGRFEVTDITRSGLGDAPVAKVDIRDARTGHEHTRYFRMEYGAVMGWRVVRETDALGFWLNVF